MSNLAHKLTPTHSPKTDVLAVKDIHYRPHMKWLYYGFIGFGVVEILLGVTLLLVISLGYKGVAVPPLFLVTALSSIMIGAFSLFEARVIFKPMAFLKCDLYEDKVTINYSNTTSEFQFDKLSAVNFSSVNDCGGSFSLHEDAREYKFSVVMKKSDLILEKIMEARPDLISKDRLIAYRRTQIFSNHAWERLYERVLNFRGLAKKYILLPCLYYFMSSTVLFILEAKLFFYTIPLSTIFGGSLLIGYFLYMTEEVIYGRKLSEDLDHNIGNTLRDIDFESTYGLRSSKSFNTIIPIIAFMTTAVILAMILGV